MTIRHFSNGLIDFHMAFQNVDMNFFAKFAILGFMCGANISSAFEQPATLHITEKSTSNLAFQLNSTPTIPQIAKDFQLTAKVIFQNLADIFYLQLMQTSKNFNPWIVTESKTKKKKTEKAKEEIEKANKSKYKKKQKVQNYCANKSKKKKYKK